MGDRGRLDWNSWHICTVHNLPWSLLSRINPWLPDFYSIIFTIQDQSLISCILFNDLYYPGSIPDILHSIQWSLLSRINPLISCILFNDFYYPGSILDILPYLQWSLFSRINPWLPAFSLVIFIIQDKPLTSRLLFSDLYSPG